jgi:hypothetical protein
MTEPAKLPEESAVPETRRGIPAIIDRLGEALPQLSPGALAELRRLGPNCTTSPAYWRLRLQHFDDSVRSEQDEQRWAALLSLMARAQGLHRRRPLGAALAAVVSEPRFLRLLRARGDQVESLLRPIVHQLVTAAEPFDQYAWPSFC